MGQSQNKSILARKVISHILNSYPDKSNDPDLTRNSIVEALASLKPFSPEPDDITTINRYLVHYQATDVACKAAWALYKDFVVNERSKTERQSL